MLYAMHICILGGQWRSERGCKAPSWLGQMKALGMEEPGVEQSWQLKKQKLVH